jgi:amidohydrolase
MPDSNALQRQAIAAVDAMSDELISISTTIHANPELGFKEFKAAALLCDTLEAHGFAVERGVGGLETAFRATARGTQDRPAVAILAEYDALAEMGHACGHNIIAASAIGAAMAVRQVIGELPGSVVAIGTPAEEGGGGKVILLKAGVFSAIDAALMVHPASYTMLTRGSLASFRLSLEFTGRASHAAAAPEDGISALQAVIQTFNNIDGLRLHLRGDARIHGIITNGGAAVNIIPEHAAALFSVRAATQKYAEEVLKRVIACAEAAAVATGAQLTYEAKQGYAAITPNKTIAGRFAENWRSIGVTVDQPRNNERMGSTDFGDVSQVVPGVHGYIAIAPPGTPGHSIEIRAAAVSAEGHRGMLNAAKAMAMTTIELLNEPELLRKVKQEFAESKA